MEASLIVFAILASVSPSFNKLMMGVAFTIGYIILNSVLGIQHPTDFQANTLGVLFLILIIGGIFVLV